MGAPLPPVPNVVSIKLQGTTPGEIWENILHVQYSGTVPGAAVLAAYATQIRNNWSGNIAGLCPSPIVLTQVVVTDLNSVSGAQGVNVTIAAGTRGDDVIGSNSAMLVSYPVGVRYRGGHPRSYLLVGGNADNQDGMSWHGAFQLEVQNQWHNFLTNSIPFSNGGTTFTQLVFVKRYGRYLPNGGPPHYVLNSPEVFPLTITASFTHLQMASQKGRIGRRSK